MSTEQKKYEEVTLYNFVSMRSPQNKEKEDPNIKTDFIFCDLIKDNSINLNSENIKESFFTDYFSLENSNQIDILSLLDFSKKLNEYKYNSFLNQCDIVNEIKEIEISEDIKKDIKRECWKSLTRVTKFGGELKFKEALVNFLKIFHIEKNFETVNCKVDCDKCKALFKRLLQSQVVIPQELLPKEDTFYFGEKIKQFKIDSEVVKRVDNNHQINLLNYQIDKLDLDETIKNEKERKLLVCQTDKKHFYKKIPSEVNYKTPLTCSVLIKDKKGVIIITIDETYFKDKKTIKQAELLIFEEGQQTAKPFAITNNVIAEKSELIFELTEENCHAILEYAATELKLSGLIQTIDDAFYRFDSTIIRELPDNIYDKIIVYNGNAVIIIDDGSDEFGQAFAPTGYGVKQLGIAEYRRVVSTISRYVPAEVAKIENVMASEYREMATIKELTKEVTEFESSESSTEKENETVSTDRFQMQNEISKIFEDKSTQNFDTKLNYGGGTTTLEISYGTATADSKTESNKQAVTNAKEVTNKAVEKIFTKVKKERTVKVTEKFTESNKHGFDNRGNENHVSGVYRHINAVYKNQIQNYGRRLLYEFAIPEPALFHKLAILEDDKLAQLIKEIPKHPCLDKLPDSEKEITKDNLQNLEILFDVPLNKYPNEIKTIKEENGGRIVSKYGAFSELIFPDSDSKYRNVHFNQLFRPKELKIQVIGREDGGTFTESIYDNRGSLFLKIGNNYSKLITQIKDTFYLPLTTIDLDFIDKESNIFDWYLVGEDFRKIAINIEITFDFNEEFYSNWQKENFTILQKKHKEENDKYLKDIKEILEENPIVDNFKEDDKEYIQHICLKKQCISYLISEDQGNNVRKMGQDMFSKRDNLETLKVNMSPKLNEYTAFARFLEQAFDWKMMSYTYYPFYWAKESQWKLMYNLYDGNESFKKFLQAGMARVVVSVRPGFEKAIMQYILTGKIWEGGEIPTYGSSLFLSIAAEMNEDPKYTIEDVWDTILPTNLIALQSSGVALNATGLPNLEKVGDLGDFKPNDNTFPAKKERKKFLGLF